MLDTSAPQTALSWPPAYTVRRSPKARRVFLQILPNQGLVVVVPYRQSKFDVMNILNEKRSWIEKIFLQREVYSTNTETNCRIEKPGSIVLPALEESWQVTYQPLAPTHKIKLIAHTLPTKLIILQGNIENNTLCHRILQRWLTKYAELRLIPWLKNLSIENGLAYKQAGIRGQSTLWGSCNAKKHISLNYKLLFLPPLLVRHVLLHELCHTKHLNHSASFWQYLKMLDSQCEEHKKALKYAERYLPKWIYDN